MKVFQLVLCAVALLLFSCNEGGNKLQHGSTGSIPSNDANAAGASIIALDERLLHMDSLVFIFYKDPQGIDSLRYTRYYTQYSSTDTAIVSFLQQNLQDTTHRLEKIKKCRSEGKIWCFARGDIFQTIYFSAFSEACSFVYIIKNGQFYYSPITDTLAHKLAAIKQKAVEI